MIAGLAIYVAIEIAKKTAFSGAAQHTVARAP